MVGLSYHEHTKGDMKLDSHLVRKGIEAAEKLADHLETRERKTNPPRPVREAPEPSKRDTHGSGWENINDIVNAIFNPTYKGKK